MFGTKTVASVFTKFTKDLQAVVNTNTAVADTAIQEQKDLKEQLKEQELIQIDANSQIVQAGKAIKNIGELLGITEGSMMVKKS